MEANILLVRCLRNMFVFFLLLLKYYFYFLYRHSVYNCLYYFRICCEKCS